MAPRSRAWCYTLNNFTEEERDALRSLKCAYHVFGYERGDEGTPHLQGYVHFTSMKSLAQMKKINPRSHWEVRKGTVDQAVEYCMKEGDFEVFGDKPMSQAQKGDANKRRFEEAFQAAKEGRMDDIPEDLRTRYYGTYKKIREDHLAKPVALTCLDNEWRYGPTGTGKTRTAHELYPDAFIKKANTKWWDGYIDQEVVIIDDFDKYHVQLGYELKIWLDHYPFPAERKGGSTMIRPKKIIITSNYHPAEIWDDDKTLQPVLRRVVLKKYEEKVDGMVPLTHPDYNIL